MRLVESLIAFHQAGMQRDAGIEFGSTGGSTVFERDAMSIVRHLESVATYPELRTAFQRC